MIAPTRSHRGHGRAALTLIEVLVVVAIIGLLVALLLPAVQGARAAARRARCANNLKQIALAIQQHAEAHGTFPAGTGRHPGRESYLVRILPYVEQQALYDSFNLADGAWSNDNITAEMQTPGVFLCPSDTGRPFQTEHAASYAGNGGRDSIRGERGEGVFISWRPLAARDIADGLSQTAGVAEWIVGAGLGDDVPRDRLRSSHGLRRIFTEAPADHDAFVRACEALDPADLLQGYGASRGQFWHMGGLSDTQYNHVMRPDRPSCSAEIDMTASTAGSFHGGGAHVATMDGGVHFVKDSIDPRVWSAVGSRSGGEVAGGGAFD